VTSLVDLTVRDAASLLAAREVSAEQLLNATLEQINETEPRFHAYATLMEDSARRHARRADQELRDGTPRSSLHGVPIGVKDLCYTHDAPTEGGSRVLKGFAPTYDATVVRLLRAAGAVIVGKTVTHEFAYVQDEPETRNPWVSDGFPGGSSAGSGVALATRTAFGAIGTDTAGSIRIPAALNGVTGLKPTYGRVSRYGVIPMAETLDTVGPMARTADDCGLMLDVISGPDRADPSALAETGMGEIRDVSGMRLGVDRDYFFGSFLRSDIRGCLEKALDDLRGLGAELIDVRIPALDETAAVGLIILLAETSAGHRAYLRSPAREAYAQATRVLLELGELVSASAYVNAQRLRRAIARDVQAAFEDEGLDALVGPTCHITTIPMNAVRVDISAGDDNTYLHLMSVANVLGLPALSVPCGLSDLGLPVGLQIIGPPMQESVLVSLGRAYQGRTDWHRRRPPLLGDPRDQQQVA